MRAKREGFTLVEVLVVMTIIGVLAATIASVTVTVRTHAILSVDASNLRQIGVARAVYMADYDDLPEFRLDPIAERLKSPELLRSKLDTGPPFLLTRFLALPLQSQVPKSKVDTSYAPVWNFGSRELEDPSREAPCAWLLNMLAARCTHFDPSQPCLVVREGRVQALEQDTSVTRRPTHLRMLVDLPWSQSREYSISSTACNESH